MDKIPKDQLIDIVRRLDSADIARCRNLFKKNFVNLISNMRVVESVCFGVNDFRNVVSDKDDVFDIVTNEGFLKEWLPKVSENLKSLSLIDSRWHSFSRRSKVLHLVSTYCYKLVELTVKDAWLSRVDTLNPMTMLTSLTLDSLKLYDRNITELNTCAPNLQVLNLVSVRGLIDPKIHLLNLRTSQLTSIDL
nr:hypothetical protein [Tanacetum cinerariifolium]